MSIFGGYQLANDDKQFIPRLIRFVREHLDLFKAAGEWLDREYSTQAIRDRDAEKLRERRSDPNRIRRTRAFQRKHYPYGKVSRQLGFTVTPTEFPEPPPDRDRGLDGKLQRPQIPLRERFDHAKTDVFSDESALATHLWPAETRKKTAARRVWLAWLYLDVDRGTITRLTEFQELRTRPLPDDDRNELADDELCVNPDGLLEDDAERWLPLAKQAIDVLEEATTSHESLSDAPTTATQDADASDVDDVTLATRSGPDTDTDQIEPRETAAHENDDDQQGRYVFRLEGEYWALRFEGERCNVKNRRGMVEVQRLLQQPNHSNAIPAINLRGIPPDAADSKTSSQDALDIEALAEYRESLNEIEVDIEGAKRQGDEAVQRRLVGEKEHILAVMKAARRPGGKFHDISAGQTSVEKVTKAVNVAISRAIKAIRKSGSPQLADHLRDCSGKDGDAFAYRPPKPPPIWQF